MKETIICGERKEVISYDIIFVPIYMDKKLTGVWCNVHDNIERTCILCYKLK